MTASIVDPALAIPTSQAEVSAAWLTQALARTHPGVVVTAVRHEPLHLGVAMTLRLHLKYAPESAPGPESVCLKCCFGSPYSQSSMDGGLYTTEAMFFSQLLPQTAVNAPPCLASGYDERTNAAFILLADVNLAGGQFCTAENSLTPDQVEDVLHQQASLHATYWNRPGYVDDPRWFHRGIPVTERNPHYDLMSEQMPQFLALPRGGVVPASLRDKSELTAAVYRVLAAAAREPQTVLHGDCHTSNLFIGGDGRAGIADWQCVRIGSWALDVGYMMQSALDPQDRRLHEKRLLESYLAKMAELGIEMPEFDHAWDLYRMHAIYGLWIWLITPPDMHPEPRITATVHKFSVAAMDLKSFQATS